MGLPPRALWLSAVFVVVAIGAPETFGQQLYKCGATFQDRPCPTEDVQQRFSHTSGGFSISQVNGDTDKDCARTAVDELPYWQRINAGESFEKVRVEIDGKPISRYEKNQMRDALIALQQYKGTAKEVRSQLELQCMNYKRMHGKATERDVAIAERSSGSFTADMRARIATDRAARAREQQTRMEDERVARLEQMQARAAAQAAARAAAEKARQQQSSRENVAR
jgi:hypothetical protein